MASTISGCKSLAQTDPEMYALVVDESKRQRHGIELIASENFTSAAVMECLGSCLTNKYSEGQPGARFYGGNEVIDKIENLCKDRALKAFKLDGAKWGVNVQPLSGSPANFEVYTALLQPHDRILSMSVPAGGHLSHGFYTGKKKISATSMYFEVLPYNVDSLTGYIDFEDVRQKAICYRPKMIIAGISAYPRDMELAKFRQIADEVEAYLMVDMAHIAGLVAAGLTASNPFDFADIVTSTTHKTLRGPRSGLIFFNIEKNPNVKTLIDNAVFPACQGGPHNHQIGAVAVQLKEVLSPDWKVYCEEVIRNAKTLAAALKDRGFKLVTDGTDNHMMLVDLRPMQITGSKFEKVAELVDITLNKNTVHGDVSAMNPSGVRIGTSAMTTRAMKEADWIKLADILKQVAAICQEVQGTHGKKLVDFMKGAVESSKIATLKAEVQGLASKLPLPGIMPDV